MQRRDFLILATLIVVTVVVRLPGVFNRAIWYDESITLLETAGNAIPDWSEQPAPARTQQELLVGAPSFREIAAGLHETDVHPPVYYVLLSKWRQVAGGSIEAARLFSVLFSAGSVLLLYLLLRSSGFERPFVPSLVYSLSSGAVHYGHEARNYSFATFLVIAAYFLAYITSTKEIENRRGLLFFSAAIGVFCGLAFQTNYLTIFPIFALLLWYLFWTSKKRRPWAILTIAITAAISLMWVGAFVKQLGARPAQFQKAVGGFWQELSKIIDFNFTILWSPVFPSSGVRIAVIGAVIALSAASAVYLAKTRGSLDRRLFTMMAGLALAPSLGVLALDIAFSKNLGKSSYVLFAGPAVAVLLALGAVHRRQGDSNARWWEGPWLGRVGGWVLPFFIGLQLTGVNFDLERTPGFAGSAIRTLTRKLEASTAESVVVIGAGHGRGDPASIIYGLEPDTTVSVIDGETDVDALKSELERYDEIWIVFAKGRMTAAVEEELVGALSADKRCRVVTATKRIAHLRREPKTPRAP